jgi:hypothetical protein
MLAALSFLGLFKLPLQCHKLGVGFVQGLLKVTERRRLRGNQPAKFIDVHQGPSF